LFVPQQAIVPSTRSAHESSPDETATTSAPTLIAVGEEPVVVLPSPTSPSPL
jgi:hypothetical protein